MNPINPDKFLDVTKATAQELFDFAVKHLAHQGCKSMDESLGCVYNGFGGAMCGAAPFIQNYDPTFEGHGYLQLVVDFGQPGEHKELISWIQDIHDAYEPYDWFIEFRELAFAYKLDHSAVELLEPLT